MKSIFMKETPIFEEVFMRLIRQPGFGLKLFIGGLLSFVPIVNLLAFGYIYRFSLQIRNTGEIMLPEWTDWQALFLDGLRFAVAWLAYWLLPIILVFLLSGIFNSIGLGVMSHLVFSITFLVSSILFSSALYRLQMRSDFKDLLDVQLIVQMSCMEKQRFMIPALVFWGIFALSDHLYGFTFFLGFLLLITYTGLCYRSIEQGRSTAI